MNTNDIGWIGHYGNMLLAMPKEHNPDRYTSLLFEGRLKEYLLAQDKFISERMCKHRGETQGDGSSVFCSLTRMAAFTQQKPSPLCAILLVFYRFVITKEPSPCVLRVSREPSPCHHTGYDNNAKRCDLQFNDCGSQLFETAI